ncbi:MAG: RHS repeat protein, partial [Clostridiales bacterium]|nr:RHS repeat protein [Clostridiales bacterium]
MIKEKLETLEVGKNHEKTSTLSVDDTAEFEYSTVSIRNYVSMHSENESGEILDELRISDTDYATLVVSIDMAGLYHYSSRDLGAYVKIRKNSVGSTAMGGMYYVQDLMGSFSATLIDDNDQYLLIPIREISYVLGNPDYITLKLIPIFDVSYLIRDNYAMLERKNLSSGIIESVEYDNLTYEEDQYFSMSDLSVYAKLDDGSKVYLAPSDYLFIENSDFENESFVGTIYYQGNVEKCEIPVNVYISPSSGLPSVSGNIIKNSGKIKESQREIDIIGGKAKIKFKNRDFLCKFNCVSPENTLIGVGITYILNTKNARRSIFGKHANLSIVEKLVSINDSDYVYQTSEGDVYNFKTNYYTIEEDRKIYCDSQTANCIEEKITVDGWIFGESVPNFTCSSILQSQLLGIESAESVNKTPVHWLYNQNCVKGYNANGNLVLISDYSKNCMFIWYTDDKQIEKVCEYTNAEKVNEYEFDYNPNGRLASIYDTEKNEWVKLYLDEWNRLYQIDKDSDATININYNETENRFVIDSSDGYEMEFEFNGNGYDCRITNYSTLSDKETETEKKMLSQTTIVEGETSATITDENGNYEHVVYDANGDEKECYTVENGVVTSAEKYNYVAYSSNEIIKADETTLYKIPFDSFVFQNGEIISETLDENNCVIKREIANTPVIITEEGCVFTNATTDYTYDSKSRCIREETSVQYFKVNTSSEFSSYKQITTYVYNSVNKLTQIKSWVENEENTSGITIEETEYNEQGFPTKTVTFNTLMDGQYVTEKTYNELGQVTTKTNQMGKVTNYTYNKGLLVGEKNPNELITAYKHDARNRVIRVSASPTGAEENPNDITYIRDEIEETTASNDSSIKYEYEIKRRPSKITVDGNVYHTFEYQDDVEENGKIVDKTFKTNAKGETVSVVEAKDGSFAEVSYNGVSQVKQTFNKDGSVSKVEDNVTGEVYDYTYDELGNVTQISKTVNGTVERTESVTYDNYGNASQKSVTGGNTVTYSYKDNAERDLESVTNTEWYTSMPKMDNYKRNTGKTVKNGDTVIYDYDVEYMTVMVNGVEQVTDLPQKTIANGEKFTYEYNELGNITKIYRGSLLYNRFHYCVNNRLIREDNVLLGKSILYRYDSNGNITKKEECQFTLDPFNGSSNENTYVYNKDKLTSFNGKAFVYDSVGNPTTYKDITLSWEKGRRLVGYGTNTFAYDGQGRRIRKNTTTYSYDSENRLISTSDGLKFYYDQDGIAGFTYQNAKYVYQKDARN